MNVSDPIVTGEFCLPKCWFCPSQALILSHVNWFLWFCVCCFINFVRFYVCFLTNFFATNIWMIFFNCDFWRHSSFWPFWVVCWSGKPRKRSALLIVTSITYFLQVCDIHVLLCPFSFLTYRIRHSLRIRICIVRRLWTRHVSLVLFELLVAWEECLNGWHYTLHWEGISSFFGRMHVEF